MSAQDPAGGQRFYFNGLPYPGVAVASRPIGGARFWFNGIVVPTLFPPSGNIINDAISLNAVVAASPSNFAAFAPSVSLNAVLRTTSGGGLDALASASMNAVIRAAASGGIDYQNSISLAAFAGLPAPGLALSMSPAATINVVAAVASASRLDAVGAASLNSVARALAIGGRDFFDSLALPVSLDQLAQAAVSIQQSATFNVVASESATGNVTINGTISLAALAGLAPAVSGELSAPLTFSMTLSVSAASAIDAQAAIDLATALAVRMHLGAKNPIGDVSVLQGTFADLIELAGIKDTTANLDGTFVITVALDGRTLN